LVFYLEKIIMAAKAKKKSIKLSSWLLYVSTTSNNTIVTLTDENGNKILWGGTWTLWYKWAKKSTPYAAEVLTRDLLNEAKWYGLNEVGIILRGVGMARDGVFKAVNETGMIDILYIKENTWLQFGWCKGKRPKRN